MKVSALILLFQYKSLFQFATAESHSGQSLLFRGAEVKQGGLGAYLILIVENFGIDKGDVAHLFVDASTQGNGTFVGCNGLEVFNFHLRCDSGSLELAGDHPSGHFVEKQRLYTAMQGVDPTLIVTVGLPRGEHIVAIFVKVEMKTDGVVGRTANAVVAFFMKPRILDFIHT